MAGTFEKGRISSSGLLSRPSILLLLYVSLEALSYPVCHTRTFWELEEPIQTQSGVNVNDDCAGA